MPASEGGERKAEGARDRGRKAEKQGKERKKLAQNKVWANDTVGTSSQGLRIARGHVSEPNRAQGDPGLVVAKAWELPRQAWWVRPDSVSWDHGHSLPKPTWVP